MPQRKLWEYSLLLFFCDAASQNSLCVTTKITEITLERIDGSLGITLRGGAIPDHPHLSRPLVITQIRPGGPAYRYLHNLYFVLKVKLLLCRLIAPPTSE